MTQNIKNLIEEITADFFAENGFVLWSTEFVKEGKDWFLRVFIDKDLGNRDRTECFDGDDEGFGNWDEGYVSTDDCEFVSRYLSEKLDESDPIEQEYYLEVSSPGMDRKLSTPAHFEKYTGSRIDVKLKSQENILQGDLIGFDTEGNAVSSVTLRTMVDTKAKNRKPGAKISPKALEIRELTFESDEIVEVRLSIVF